VRTFLKLLPLVLAGCASTGSSDLPPDDGTPKVIKVSYLRFDYIQDPRTGKARWVHNYRLMLSQGWTDKRGRERLNEPFLRAFRDPFYSDSVPDGVMQKLVNDLQARGFDSLKTTPAERFNLEQMRRQEREGNRDALKWIRIITVETEAGARCVCFEDNDDTGRGTRPVGPQTRAFLECERQVLAVATGYTIQVTVEKDPANPR